MNRNKMLAAQCLIEAADLLESAGRNGFGRRLAKAQQDTPEFKKARKIANQYTKAGYEDKIPEKYDRMIYENDVLLDRYNSKAGSSKHKDPRNTFADNSSESRASESRKLMNGYQKNRNYAREQRLGDSYYDKQQLHDRINKRGEKKSSLKEAIEILSSLQ